MKPGAATHGYSGPLKVSYGGIFTNIGQQFLDAVALYDEERGFTEDVNGLFSCNAYGVSIALIILDSLFLSISAEMAKVLSPLSFLLHF